MTVTVAECEREPLVPVTLTVYVPTGVEDLVETVRISVAEPPGESVTLGELSETVGPLLTTGDMTADKLTVPWKGPRLEKVMVADAEFPFLTVKLAGLAEILKSTTFTITVTECRSRPAAANQVKLYFPGVVCEEVDTVTVSVPVPPADTVVKVLQDAPGGFPPPEMAAMNIPPTSKST